MPVTSIMASGHLTKLCLYLSHSFRYGNEMTFGVVQFTAIALFLNPLCREGVQSNVVYLGGFSIGG